MKNFLKIAIILVLGFVIYSCSKENDNFAPEDEGNDFGSPLASRGEGCDIDTANPFDYAGQIHNEVVQAYLDKYPDGTRNITEMAAVTDALCLENDKFREHYGTEIVPTDPQVIEKIVRDYENDYTFIREMISQKDVSELTKEKLKDLIDFIITESQQEREPNYEVFDSKLANFERDIMNSGDYSQEESEILLSSISIARHSACLWHGQYAGELMKGKKPRRSFWHWVTVIVGDIGGFLDGNYSLNAGCTASEAVDDALLQQSNDINSEGGE